MNEKLNQALADLSAKLGTTTEHLWGVLLRQATIAGISRLLSLAFILLLAGAAIYATFWLGKRQDAMPFFTAPIRYLILAFVLVFLLITAGYDVYWATTDFFNPEYYALRQLPGFD